MRIELSRIEPSHSPANSLRRSQKRGNNLPGFRTCFSLALLSILSCTSAFAQLKTYKTFVVFGDSLSDTGNAAQLAYNLSRICGPSPCFDYTAGRFTDGSDTVPAAQKYFGVWIEQLAASLPSHPAVTASLSGGTNYAYGYATTGNGTSPLTLGSITIQVENIGQQITDYLSTHPKIDNQTLIVIWGGADNLLQASSATDVSNAAIQQTLNIQRLIQAGATQFLVPNLPPLGRAPEFNGSLSTSLPATAASVLYNSYLAVGLSVLKDINPFKRLAFYQLDVFNLLLRIDADPLAYSLVNVTTPAQGQALVNPDTYLFWDDLHPTTRGHNILADAALNLLSQ
jgi:phospholipase/lecithinase/hemolysin